MSYYYPNKTKLLQNIRQLTKEKTSTSASELFLNVPEKERKDGFGWGNMQNALYELF